MSDNRIRSIAVFCGSSYGRNKEYAEAAAELGKVMAEKGISLVFGGGGKGLMGTIAKSVREHGGKVIGVLPEAMNVPDVRKNAVETELIIVPGMHERKKTMYEKADAFIAMPGGIGTLEELSEIFTWRQLGYHEKNIAVMNTTGYYDDLLRFLEHAVSEGFMAKSVLDELIVINDVKDSLRLLERKARELPNKL